MVFDPPVRMMVPLVLLVMESMLNCVPVSREMPFLLTVSGPEPLFWMKMSLVV